MAKVLVVFGLVALFAGAASASSLCTTSELTNNSTANSFNPNCFSDTISWGQFDASMTGSFNTGSQAYQTTTVDGEYVSLLPSSGLSRVDNSVYYYDPNMSCHPSDCSGGKSVNGWTPSSSQGLVTYGGTFNAPDQTNDMVSSSTPYGDTLISSSTQTLTLTFLSKISELSLQVGVEDLGGPTTSGLPFSVTMTAYTGADGTGSIIGSSNVFSNNGGKCTTLNNNPPTACRMDDGTGNLVGTTPFLGFATTGSADIQSVVISIDSAYRGTVGSLLVDTLYLNQNSYPEGSGGRTPEPSTILTLGCGAALLAFIRRRRSA